ncbi:MAG: hypothetical protein HZB92_01745 [Euryarchaeota archaeon]|nr:hypothetical protein [Euryarchaeota archaeon]
MQRQINRLYIPLCQYLPGCTPSIRQSRSPALGTRRAGPPSPCPTSSCATYGWRALHKNQIWLCIYTPFKGWIKFKMCRDDLRKLKASVEKLQRVMGWLPR